MTTSQNTAKRELAKMKHSLKRWLKYRELNDKAGTTAFDIADRAQYESVLAIRLKKLLTQIHGQIAAPDDVVELAKMAIGEQPSALGIWPLAIVAIVAGAALFAVVAAISSYADVAKERERIRCIEKGACTDYGFYLKWGAILGGAYFLWTKTDLPKSVNRLLGKR